MTKKEPSKKNFLIIAVKPTNDQNKDDYFILYFAVFSIKKVLIIIIHWHNQECQAVIIQTSQFKGLVLLLPNAQHNLDASFSVLSSFINLFWPTED